VPAPKPSIDRSTRRRLDAIEARLAAIQTERVGLEQRLGEPALHRTGARTELAEITTRQRSLDTEQSTLEEEWIALSSAIEAG
jgi:chromosome segregation ATPase